MIYNSSINLFKLKKEGEILEFQKNTTKYVNKGILNNVQICLLPCIICTEVSNSLLNLKQKKNSNRGDSYIFQYSNYSLKLYHFVYWLE